MIPAGFGVTKSAWSSLKPAMVSQVLRYCEGFVLGPGSKEQNIVAFAHPAMQAWYSVSD